MSCYGQGQDVGVQLGPNQGSKLDRIVGQDENIFSLRLRSDSFGKWTSSAIVADPPSLPAGCPDLNIRTQESSHSMKKRKKEIVTRFLRSFVLAIKFENYVFLYWSSLQ